MSGLGQVFLRIGVVCLALWGFGHALRALVLGDWLAGFFWFCTGSLYAGLFVAMVGWRGRD